MSDQLKPCPFCGSTATMRGGSDRASWIICDNKKCSATQGLELSGKNAVQMWNHRHAEDALKAEVERLKAALKKIAEIANRRGHLTVATWQKDAWYELAKIAKEALFNTPDTGKMEEN